MEPQAHWTPLGSLVWLFRFYLVPQLPGMLQAKRGQGVLPGTRVLFNLRCA